MRSVCRAALRLPRCSWAFAMVSQAGASSCSMRTVLGCEGDGVVRAVGEEIGACEPARKRLHWLVAGDACGFKLVDSACVVSGNQEHDAVSPVMRRGVCWVCGDGLFEIVFCCGAVILVPIGDEAGNGACLRALGIARHGCRDVALGGLDELALGCRTVGAKLC